MAKSKKVGKGKKLMKFSCFKKLPPELRNMVWKHAIPGSRIVDIKGGTHPSRGTHFNRPVVLSASYKVPILLQVSYESRAVALKVYTKLFDKEFRDRPVYFNLAVDVLSVQDTPTLYYLCSLGGFRSQWGPNSSIPKRTSVIVPGLRRLQFRKEFSWSVINNIKGILYTFGQPEMINIHRPYGRWSVLRTLGFYDLKDRVKAGWLDKSKAKEDEDGLALDEDEEDLALDEGYLPSLHYLTVSKLKKMTVSIQPSAFEEGLLRSE